MGFQAYYWDTPETYLTPSVCEYWSWAVLMQKLARPDNTKLYSTIVDSTRLNQTTSQ